MTSCVFRKVSEVKIFVIFEKRNVKVSICEIKKKWERLTSCKIFKSTERRWQRSLFVMKIQVEISNLRIQRRFFSIFVVFIESFLVDSSVLHDLYFCELCTIWKYDDQIYLWRKISKTFTFETILKTNQVGSLQKWVCWKTHFLGCKKW